MKKHKQLQHWIWNFVETMDGKKSVLTFYPFHNFDTSHVIYTKDLNTVRYTLDDFFETALGRWDD